MKKFFFLLSMVTFLTLTASASQESVRMSTHELGAQQGDMEIERIPLQLPISVYYDSDTNILEVWCDDDNIQAEVFLYDKAGALECYSPYMNVGIQLTTEGSHSIILKGDGWQAEGEF